MATCWCAPRGTRHYWGNLLIFDEAPRPGDRERWSALFEAEFADERGCAIAPSPGPGRRVAGSAREEFEPAGYEFDRMVASWPRAASCVATAGESGGAHPAARPSPAPIPRCGAGDRAAVAGRDQRFDEAMHRDFTRSRRPSCGRSSSPDTAPGMSPSMAAPRGAWQLRVVVTDGRAASRRSTRPRRTAAGHLLPAGRRGGADERRRAPGDLRRPRLPRSTALRIARFRPVERVAAYRCSRRARAEAASGQAPRATPARPA